MIRVGNPLALRLLLQSMLAPSGMISLLVLKRERADVEGLLRRQGLKVLMQAYFRLAVALFMGLKEDESC